MNARLLAHGFTQPYEGAAYYEKEVPGRFKFTVQVTVEDHDGDRLPRPTYRVSLPHQCDNWEIANTDDPWAGLTDLEAFAAELAQAHTMLAEIGVSRSRMTIRTELTYG